MTDRESREAELDRLKARVETLEAELTRTDPHAWVPSGYYTTYHMLAGMTLGLLAATASLIFNVIGSAMFGKYPLELIRVYLTFPLGEKALQLNAADNGFALASGCCLYLGTGMIGGVPFHMILTRYFDKAGTSVRIVVAAMLGLGVWIINFYGVLYWLQPMLIGGRWIVDLVPWYVAAATHIVFGWTMLAVNQWGRFQPPQHSAKEPTE